MKVGQGKTQPEIVAAASLILYMVGLDHLPIGFEQVTQKRQRAGCMAQDFRAINKVAATRGVRPLGRVGRNCSGTFGAKNGWRLSRVVAWDLRQMLGVAFVPWKWFWKSINPVASILSGNEVKRIEGLDKANMGAPELGTLGSIAELSTLGTVPVDMSITPLSRFSSTILSIICFQHGHLWVLPP